MTDKKLLRVQAQAEQIAAAVRDTGPKHELSEMEMAALITLAEMGLLYRAATKIEDPKLRRSAREQAERIAARCGDACLQAMAMTVKVMKDDARFAGVFGRREKL